MGTHRCACSAHAVPVPGIGNRKKAGIWPALLILVCQMISGWHCAPNPVNSDTPAGETSKLTVIVRNTNYEPMSGFQVTTSPETETLTTDERGVAVFETLMPDRRYQIVIGSSTSALSTYQEIATTKYPQSISFVIAVNVTLNLKLHDIHGIPLTGTELYTSPPTALLVTDENGRAVLEHIILQPYTFLVVRNGVTAYIRNQQISIRNGTVQDIELVVEPQVPLLTITEPLGGLNHSIFNVSFKGFGQDFEDGALCPDSLAWYSDINGRLGTGAELNVERLSIGEHTITLEGRDSQGGTGTRSIRLRLFHLGVDSYFPIPPGCFWNYANMPASFTVLKDGASMTYTLTDVGITMESVNERTSTMSYFLEGEKRSGYEYTVTDYLIDEGDGLYITKTTEQMKILSPLPEDRYEMNIVTEYDRKYPLMIDHIDPSANNFSFSCTARVTDPLSLFTEEIEVRSETSFLGYETVTTAQGTFEAAVLKIVQGETARIWWLAKGMGIVQLAYNTLGAPVTSTLVTTNVRSALAQNTAKRTDRSAAQTHPVPDDARALDELRTALAFARAFTLHPVP